MPTKFDIILENAVAASHGNSNLHKFALRQFISMEKSERELEIDEIVANTTIQTVPSGPEPKLVEILETHYRRFLDEDMAHILAWTHIRALTFNIDHHLGRNEGETEESDLTTTEFIEIMAKLNRSAPDMVSEDLDKMVRAAKAFKKEFM